MFTWKSQTNFISVIENEILTTLGVYTNEFSSHDNGYLFIII